MTEKQNTNSALWKPLDDHARPTGLYAPGHDDVAKAKAAATVTQAYAEAPDNRAKWDASKATTWQYRADMEHLATIRDTNPAAYNTMAAVQKMELGYYLDARSAAEAAGVDLTAADK